MPLIKADHIINELIEKDDMLRFDNLTCWEKRGVNYSIYIFAIQIKNNEGLIELKDKLRDYIAIYFQSQMLEKAVEQWNIYQVFLTQEDLPTAIKQQIEQDKFATRKIVIADLQRTLSDDDISHYIFSEIFEFIIPERKADDNPINNILDSANKKTLDILSKYPTKEYSQNIAEIIKELNDE